MVWKNNYLHLSIYWQNNATHARNSSPEEEQTPQVPWIPMARKDMRPHQGLEPWFPGKRWLDGGTKNPVGSTFSPPKRQYLYISDICKWDIYCQLGDNMPSTTFLREPKNNHWYQSISQHAKPWTYRTYPGNPQPRVDEGIPITL